MENSYSLILSRLEIFIRKYYLNLVIKGAILFSAVLFLLFLLTSVTAYFAWLSVLSRSLIFYCSLLLLISLAWQFIGRHLLAYYHIGRRMDHHTASLLIGAHFPEIKDKLLNTIQLHELNLHNSAYSALIQAGINQKIEAFRPLSFTSAIDLRGNVRYLRFVLIPFFSILVLVLVAPVILREGSTRLLHHDRPYIKPAPFAYLVMNTSLEAVQGSNFTLDIRTKGSESPAEMFIAGSSANIPVERTGKNSFRYQFVNIQHSRQLTLYASGIYSAPITIMMVPRPELLNFKVHLDYPAYLQRAPETIINTGDLIVPEGTQATWTCSTRNASSILFTLNGIPTRISDNPGHELTLRRVLVHSGKYSFIPSNEHHSVPDTLSYAVQVVQDQNPEIQVTKLPDSAQFRTISFSGLIHDDYGFSRLNFMYGPCNEKGDLLSAPDRIPVDISKRLLSQTFFYTWQTSDLLHKPGDRLAAFFEVFDNDGLHGPKKARSAMFFLAYPSKDSILHQINQDQRSMLTQLKSSASSAAEIQSEARALSDKIANQESLNYEDRKQASQIMAKQGELEKNLDQLQKLNEKTNALSSNSDENSLLKLKEQEIAKIFKNLIDPKTQELLDKLQKLIAAKDKNNSRESLQNLQTDTKSLGNELERLKELYKRMAFEQTLERSSNQLKALGEKQKALSLAGEKKQTSASKPALAKTLAARKAEQAEIKKQFSQIKEDLHQNELTKPADAPFNNPEKEEQKIASSLKSAEDKLSSGKPEKASAPQKEAADQMKDLGEKINQMQDQSSTEELAKDLGSVRMILQNLLRVSFAEEALMKRLKGINPNDPVYTALVEKQFELKEDLGLIRDSVYSLSKKVPQIQSLVNRELSSIHQNLESTVQFLGDRRLFEAASRQQYIMTSVNNLAVLLSNTEDQLSKAMKNAKSPGKGKGKGKGQGPTSAELGKMQDALNKEMQQKSGSPRNGSEQMSEDMAKMAARQQAIREAYEQLNRKEGGSPNKALNQALKKMDESETDLLNRRLNSTLINRQKEISSRLLEAAKASREQEMDNHREARQGMQLAPAEIAAIKKVQDEKIQEQNLIKTILPDMNNFYKLRINSYFKKLNAFN